MAARLSVCCRPALASRASTESDLRCREPTSFARPCAVPKVCERNCIASRRSRKIFSNSPKGSKERMKKASYSQVWSCNKNRSDLALIGRVLWIMSNLGTFLHAFLTHTRTNCIFSECSRKAPFLSTGKHVLTHCPFHVKKTFRNQRFYHENQRQWSGRANSLRPDLVPLSLRVSAPASKKKKASAPRRALPGPPRGARAAIAAAPCPSGCSGARSRWTASGPAA